MFKKQTQNFLAVQWLELHALTAEGPGFDPCSGNQDPKRSVVWPKKLKKKKARLIMLFTYRAFSKHLLNNCTSLLCYPLPDLSGFF